MLETKLLLNILTVVLFVVASILFYMIVSLHKYYFPDRSFYISCNPCPDINNNYFSGSYTKFGHIDTLEKDFLIVAIPHYPHNNNIKLALSDQTHILQIIPQQDGEALIYNKEIVRTKNDLSVGDFVKVRFHKTGELLEADWIQFGSPYFTAPLQTNFLY